jgi:hypothetical protein
MLMILLRHTPPDFPQCSPRATSQAARPAVLCGHRPGRGSERWSTSDRGWVYMSHDDAVPSAESLRGHSTKTPSQVGSDRRPSPSLSLLLSFIHSLSLDFDHHYVFQGRLRSLRGLGLHTPTGLGGIQRRGTGQHSRILGPELCQPSHHPAAALCVLFQ